MAYVPVTVVVTEPVAALLIGTIKTIARGAPTLKTKQALGSFWGALSLYASRNLAEVEGTGAPAAAPKAAVAKAAQPKAKKAKAPEPAGQTATA